MSERDRVSAVTKHTLVGVKSLRAVSWYPRFSNREMISPTSLRMSLCGLYCFQLDENIPSLDTVRPGISGARGKAGWDAMLLCGLRGSKTMWCRLLT
jgi:hypothetical protein